MIRRLPSTSGPNSGPATMNTFSFVLPYRKAFPTSPAQTWSPLRRDKMKLSLTASMETTPENTSSFGGSVRCPPATKRHLYLPSNLTS